MLREALALADDLERTLSREVERARYEREALRTLDSDRLFVSAAQRAAFNGEVSRLESALSEALGRAAAGLGLPEVTLESLAARAPVETAALEATFSAIRALAGSLAALDRLNLVLARRALSCVQGYLAAVDPSPAAYDRRGARAAVFSRPVFSNKA